MLTQDALRGAICKAPDEFGRSDGIVIAFHSLLFDVRGIYDELLDSKRRSQWHFFVVLRVFRG